MEEYSQVKNRLRPERRKADIERLIITTNCNISNGLKNTGKNLESIMNTANMKPKQVKGIQFLIN